MNLIDLMKCRFVFDLLESELLKLSYNKNSFRAAFSKRPVDLVKVRATVRSLQGNSLKITNIKVTSKDKSKTIISFHSDNDRYHCIWDFAEGSYISRSVNR